MKSRNQTCHDEFRLLYIAAWGTVFHLQLIESGVSVHDAICRAYISNWSTKLAQTVDVKLTQEFNASSFVSIE